MPLAFLLLLVALLSACASAPAVDTPDDPLAVDPTVEAATPLDGAGPADLDAARERWAAAALDGYAMTVTRSCFCPPEYRGPYEVTVEDGALASVLYEGRPSEGGEPPTVEGLFDLLADAYARGAARVDVTYHADLGYPVTLYIDRDEQMADEEMGYAVSELLPL